MLRTAPLAGLLPWLGSRWANGAEPPPETRKIRLVHFPGLCVAFGYLAKDLLHAEGFDEVDYVDLTVNTMSPLMAEGKVDIWAEAAPALVNFLATDSRIVALGGVHAGCYELAAHEPVRSIRDLKRRSVAISGYGTTEHVFVSSMAAYVGIDPRSEINWRVGANLDEAMQLFTDRKADAYLGGAPQPQTLRDRGIGHVILNTTEDRPWSQYFCCMLSGNREFVRRHPVATKRAMRAFLKAIDICATEPERVARHMVERGYEKDYDLAVSVIRSLPHNRWRDSNPEDTLRFHALRLREGGIIKVAPEKLIAQGTDWRFLNALKRELKT